MYKINIDREFKSATHAATALRKIAESLERGVLSSAKTRYTLYEEKNKVNVQSIEAVEAEEESKQLIKFGLTMEEWQAELKAAIEYMERWGLNDTLSWLMEKHDWSRYEAGILINEIKHTSKD